MSAVSLALTAVASWSAGTVQPGELQEFSTQHNTVIVDVRTPAEFKEGHIPGAVNVPHQAVVDDPSVLHRYRDKTLVVYCRTGRRTRAAIDSLESAGFERVYHLQGDIEGWLNADLPLQHDR